VYGLSIGDKSGNLGWTLAYFFGKWNFCTTDFSHFLSERDEIWQYWGSGQWKLIPGIRELWSGGPVIPCDDMHHSFRPSLTCKVHGFLTTSLCLPIVLVFFRFNALPEGASFLYKWQCTASRGGSLRQHSLLVAHQYVARHNENLGSKRSAT